MAIEHYKRAKPSVKGGPSPTASDGYIIRGSDVEADIIAYSVANIPLTYFGLVLKSINYDREGPDFWYVSVEYGLPEGEELEGQGDPPPPPPAEPEENEPLGFEWSFDTTGGTQHITQSISTISQTTRAGEPISPVTDKAIGVSKDEVKGTDIVSPKLIITRGMDIPFVTLFYIKRLVECTATINELPYLGFGVGELLFLGATLNYTSTEKAWNAKYQFAAAKTLTDLEICDGLVVGEKKGWHYIWVGYHPNTDVGANVLIKKPWYANVEHVYQYKDFRALLGW